MIREKDGQMRRINPEVTENIEARLASLKRGLARAQRTQSLKDDDRWIAVRESLETKIKNIDDELDNFQTKEPRQNDLKLAQRFAFKTFISMVEDVDNSIASFESLIDQTEKELSGRKEPSAV